MVKIIDDVINELRNGVIILVLLRHDPFKGIPKSETRHALPLARRKKEDILLVESDVNVTFGK